LSPNQEQAMQIEQIAEALDRARSETLGIYDVDALPDDLRNQLHGLIDNIESLTEELGKVAQTLKQEAPDRGE
jgi:hypothetical protein